MYALIVCVVIAEVLWRLAFLHVSAADLAAAAAVSQLLASCVAAAVGETVPILAVCAGRGRTCSLLPSQIGWAEALRRAIEWPRLLVFGGEDAMDMPQLHLSLISFTGSGSCVTASHLRRAMPNCSLPCGRYRLSATCIGLEVYLTGGIGPEGEACPEVLRMNALTHAWAHGQVPQAPMRIPRYGHESVCVSGRYIMCIGGKAADHTKRSVDESVRSLDIEVGGSIDCLDTYTGRWLPLPCRLACPRVYFGAAVVGTTVVVSGGAALGQINRNLGPSECRLSSTELLDASELHLLFEGHKSLPSLRWQPGPSLIVPRCDFSLGGPIDGCIFAVGGSGARCLVECLEVSNIHAYLGANPATATSGLAELPGRQGVQDVHEHLLSHGWVDFHMRTPPHSNSGNEQVTSSPASELYASPVKKPPCWKLHPVELPKGRSSGNVVAIGRTLCLVGGSERSLLHYRPGDEAWQTVDAELDAMRLGSRAVAVGCTPHTTFCR